MKLFRAVKRYPIRLYHAQSKMANIAVSGHSGGLSPYRGKTEYMLFGRGKFTGPLQDIKLGNNSLKQVLVSRCLGLEIDYHLNWKLPRF